MAVFAVDASTLLATVLAEDQTQAARSFLGALRLPDRIVGPGLLLSECTSTLREEVFDRRISRVVADQALSNLLALQLEIVTDVEQHRLAWQYAAILGTRKAYDAHYLAVASLRRAEIVTIDSGMYQGAVNFKIPARLLR